MNHDDEREKIGKPCKTCGHPAGAHGILVGEDIDEPATGAGCRHEGCDCRVYGEEE